MTDPAADPWQDFDGHEQVIVAQHGGVRMVVAVHSTVLGPALGGTRMATYADCASPAAAAYADALRLSRAMTYKNALAGLDHGGGKGVILADPSAKPRELLHAYARLVEGLGGRYVTAGDVGMTVADMDLIGEQCRWTTGRSPEHGGVGDSGILTAFGVFEAMRASAAAVWGTPDLAGRRVGIVGAGKVGGRLIGHLVQAGAVVIAVDPSAPARAAVLAASPSVRFVAGIDELLAEDLDVVSPNALGGFLTRDRAATIRAALVCGGANNQLAEPAVGDLLAQHGIVYAPDFMVNCGGVIQVAEELVGCDLDRARAQTARVFDTTARVLARAASEGVTPVAAAEAEAEDRIRTALAAAGRQVL
ncbi:MAG: Glu/Leu/Phe/Val dehydrogenase dimerization domain-containing protein [Candidatus Nanopelagicales bacterium]